MYMYEQMIMNRTKLEFLVGTRKDDPYGVLDLSKSTIPHSLDAQFPRWIFETHYWGSSLRPKLQVPRIAHDFRTDSVSG